MMGGVREGPDFFNLHRNKRSITLNLKTADGVAILKRLAAGADVLIENYRPDVKRRLGIDYIGVTFRTRSVAEVREINRAMRADLWDAVAKGELRLPIDRTFPLGQAAAALAHMRANAHFGKIVLTV